jgi:hypothetical protein
MGLVTWRCLCGGLALLEHFAVGLGGKNARADITVNLKDARINELNTTRISGRLRTLRVLAWFLRQVVAWAIKSASFSTLYHLDTAHRFSKRSTTQLEADMILF